MGLRRVASLVRFPAIRVFAPTWGKGSINIANNLISIQKDIEKKELFYQLLQILKPNLCIFPFKRISFE
jgi:hypothetical protein